MNIEKAVEILRRKRACNAAVTWASCQVSGEAAWANCVHGGWMLWLVGTCAAGQESDARRKLTLAACECARLALKYVAAGELRPLRAIETAEQWARGEAGVTIDDVRDAADTAARASARAAYATADASATAAAAAAAAADTTDDSAAAAGAAAAAAAYAAYAAGCAAGYAAVAQQAVLAECANIVRKHYPDLSFLAAEATGDAESYVSG
jgi:hypothetical protein